MRFYLGTHEPSWLTRTTAPLFLSRRRLSRLKALPPVRGEWALDSGGFSELSMFGRWLTASEQYADEAARYADEIGGMTFAAVQDWMCEPFVLQKTGLSIREHQERTIRSYLDLRALAPDVPWAPVLQGWAVDDYLSHAEQYRAAGIDLGACVRVGVGSVCRRQASYQTYDLFSALKPLGLALHGFGLKQGFLRHAFSAGLASFDSMAWSYKARRRGSPIEGCTHATCANCLRYALKWREAIVSIGKKPQQELLMLTGESC